MNSYLVFVDTLQNSNKFWSAKVEGNKLTVQWGRVGYNPQEKVHNLPNNQAAVNKFNELVSGKKAKGYSESKPEMDGDRSVADIRRAIQLLDTIRPAVANRSFGDSYITALNQYLKIVPTPLGMQIHPNNVYRSVEDVDHQRELLNSLLVPSQPVEPVAVTAKSESKEAEPKTISLKTIGKSFWRHLQ